MSRSRTRRARVVLATLAVTTGLAATAAVVPTTRADAAPTVAPGSIVYLKGDNIWIARADGSGARAVTTDGAPDRPYFSPSEADDGTIAAARLGEIVRMTQQGRVLNRIDPPALRFGSGETFDGTPADVAISPDGKYIAWSFVAYTCPVDLSCAVRYATGYTTATKLDTRAGHVTNYHAPSWIGSARTIQSGGYNVQVMLQDRKASPVHWFDDHDIYFPSTDLSDTELSRDGKWLGAVRGFGNTSTIIWYAVKGGAKTGPPPAPPTPRCVTNADAAMTSPTFAPDSELGRRAAARTHLTPPR